MSSLWRLGVFFWAFHLLFAEPCTALVVGSKHPHSANPIPNKPNGEKAYVRRRGNFSGLIKQAKTVVQSSEISSEKDRSIQFYSQASQDRFVYTLLYQLLGKRDGGYYLEI